MTERKKGNVVVFGFVGLIVLTAALLGVLVFTAPSSKTSDRPSIPSEASEDRGMVVGEDGRLVPYGGDTEVAEDAPAQEESEDEMTPEERAASAAEAARELVGGEPIYCESPCDCPQGQSCQTGSQLCLPSPFPVYCCDNDGCPEGNPCVFADGSFGVCGG